MCKNISFTAAAAMLALVMIFAAKSSVVASTGGHIHPVVELSPLASAYLPIYTLDEAY